MLILFFFFSPNLSAQEVFKTGKKEKRGEMQASAVFSSEGINTITQKVQGLVSKHNYDIAIHLTPSLDSRRVTTIVRHLANN